MTIRGITSAVWREWQLATRDPRVVLTLVAVALLTLLALVVGWHRAQQRIERQQAIVDDNAKQQSFLESAFEETLPASGSASDLSRADTDRQLALQMSARSPDLMRFTGGVWTSYLPATPLAGFATGASESWPNYYRHAGLSVTETLSRSTQPNPLLAVTGAYDMTLLVGVILPLAVLILTFDVVAADRESGRWTLVQTQCRSIIGLIATRCLLRVMVLASVVAALVVAWIVLFPVGEIDLSAITRIMAFTAWLLGYLMFWGMLAFSVASFRLSSAGSGTVLVLCWSMLVLFVPSLVERGVSKNAGLPALAEFSEIEERARKQVERDADAVWAEYLRQHPEVVLDDENPQLEFILRDIANQHAARSQVDIEFREHLDRYLDRESQVDWSQLLTPAMAWRTVCEQYAGASLRHDIDFAWATAEFHYRYIRFFEPMTLEGRELSLAEIQSLPQFDGQQLSERLYALPLLLAATSMLMWTGLVGLIGWTRLQRVEMTTDRRKSGGRD